MNSSGQNWILGFERPDGKVGIRNHVAVIPTVVCATVVARRIAMSLRGASYVDNQFGCSQLEPDLEVTFRTLAGVGRNPNVASVLLVSLGCEELPVEKLADTIASSGKSVEVVVIQECGGTTSTVDKGVAVLKRLVEEASRLRPRRFDVSSLVIGVKCGGSDATSGIAANPVVGYVSDKVVDLGGTIVMSETPEMIGAEHVLIKRIAEPATRDKLLAAIKRWLKIAEERGVDIVGAQPTRGNIAGGITTIEEKSLGAIIKGGSRPIRGILEYAEEIKGRGLYIMDTPGNDAMSLAGMVAGGAQMILFTTGRGTPLGNPVAPVIKITGNPHTYARMRENMDFDASPVLLGQKTVSEVGEQLFELVLEVARGKLTRAEVLGHNEFVINKILPSL
ncbi:MAG: altronate dehydratase [Thermoprotei archaeon]|nr:MAG: altronate dehydratase [Thermoprotei archaeon]